MHELKKFTATVKTFSQDCLFKSPHTPLAKSIILSLKELKKKIGLLKDRRTFGTGALAPDYIDL
jgi:hypothetical protein